MGHPSSHAGPCRTSSNRTLESMFVAEEVALRHWSFQRGASAYTGFVLSSREPGPHNPNLHDISENAIGGGGWTRDGGRKTSRRYPLHIIYIYTYTVQFPLSLYIYIHNLIWVAHFWASKFQESRSRRRDEKTKARKGKDEKDDETLKHEPHTHTLWGGFWANFDYTLR